MTCTLGSVAAEILNALDIIFPNSLDSGMVPVDWKTIDMTFQFKKGGRLNVGNHRPISLTSVIGKMRESIIQVIAEYLETHKYN